MNISALIIHLQNVQAEHGDLRIVKSIPYAPLGAVREFSPDDGRVRNLKTRNARESYDKVIERDSDEDSGVKVLFL